MLAPAAAFFFHAEDGIRDDLVTGVQTCALPIFSLATLMGTAKPTPDDCWGPLVMIMVLMPMTSPRVLSSGPPELPGLIDASVWIMSTAVPRTPRVRPRPLYETTPTVTLGPPTWPSAHKPKGLPMAITHSPTSAWSELPRFRIVKGSLGSILMSATSVRASLPTSLAS